MFDRLWCLHDAEPRLGPLNMAIDELLLEHAVVTARPILRTYAWAEPYVSMGYFDRVDWIAEQFPNRSLVRRWTGGGAVDHAKDFTFTLAVPGLDRSSHWPAAQRYSAIHACVSTALEQFGVVSEPLRADGASGKTANPAPCFDAPVCGDLTFEGQKIVGGAQRRTRAGVLHQGSIQKLPWRIDREALASALTGAFGHERDSLTLDGEWFARAQALADTKYATREWLRSR